MRITISIYLWLLVFTTFILFLPVITILWVLTNLFDKRLIVIHYFSSFWATLYIWLNPLWKIDIEGKNKVVQGQSYVIISNHQSLLDIALLYALFLPYKWVTKVENFKIPGIGWIMILNKYIRVDRNNKETYLQMVNECKNSLRSGSSVLLFPEGTRSRDGIIGEFKTGPFKIAKEANSPILPIIIDGSGKAMPEKGFILTGKQRLKVKILDPIPFNSFNETDSKELAKEIYNVMVREYNYISQN